jgi:phosphoribosylaminoimidazolecarboxamide formyltransferase/IMP cyclohydrolase
VKIKRALISVSDKAGIVEFARFLHGFGVEILSTGGTARLLHDAKIPVGSVSDYTGFPEILEGRVKTLHPRIYGAILARRDSIAHMKQIEKHDIIPIDLVVVNLYPFEETISKEGVTQEEAIENIDIGGPTMIRAAAKNYQSVAVVVSPDQYAEIIKELKESDGGLSLETRESLSREAFAHTARYDEAITEYFEENQKSKIKNQEEIFPQSLNLKFEKVQDLRYGENPHQRAAFYRDLGVAQTEQLHGKELSFNNRLDLDAAWRIAREFEEPVAVIIKHTNPCGVACDEVLSEAYRKARSCDPTSAFGSVVGFNREVDQETAQEIDETFVECVITPGFSGDALGILKKKKGIRLIQHPASSPPHPPRRGETSPSAGIQHSERYDLKKVFGGLLVQGRDTELFGEELKVATRRKPTDEELEALKFAWHVTKYVKSNAVVLCNQTQTLGIGAGQMSRIDSVRLAIMKMSDHQLPVTDHRSPITDHRVLVLASDAFFPFRDSIDEAKKVGVMAVIQPGGSNRDEEVIAACNEYDISMVFTGMRHFRH